MHTFWHAVLDLVLPPTAEQRMLRQETDTSFARTYQPQRYRTHTALGSYNTPILKAAVVSNKYQANRHAAKLLASLCSQYFSSISGPIYCIPIPLSHERHRERGYNQTTVITKYLHHTRPDLTTVPLLSRHINTKPQTKCTRSERMQNVRDVFQIHHARPLPAHAHIYIIDDVVTTGATLDAAAATLQQQYPLHSIHTLAITRS
jgi:ComF family protein